MRGHCYTALVCGGRLYAKQQRISEFLSLFGVRRLVHGDAEGADTCAKCWALFWGIPQDPVPIQRPRENGFDRNTRMLAEYLPQIDIVIAFPGNNGTADMVRKARKAGLPVMEIPDGP